MNSLTIPWDLSPTTDTPPPRRSRPSSNNNDPQSHQMVTMASLMLAPGQSYHPQIDLKHFEQQAYQPPTTFTFTSQPPHFRSASQRSGRQSSSSTSTTSSVASSSDQECKPRMDSLASSTSPSNSASASTPPSSASPPTSASPSSSSSAGDVAGAESGGDSSSHWNVGIFGGAGGFGLGGEEGGAECLACGYRYEDLGLLAEHQRMEHGLVDVVF